MKVSGKFRWGILGCARIAVNKFIPAVQKLKRMQVVAIASRTLSKAQQHAAALVIARAYGSYHQLLDDPDVDAIYNPLPNNLHCEWTIRAAEHGKHVLCEKPLALNVSEARRMIAASRRNHVLLMEAFMYRFHPQWDVVRRLIDKERIGEPRLVRTTFSFVLSRPPGNYRIAHVGTVYTEDDMPRVIGLVQGSGRAIPDRDQICCRPHSQLSQGSWEVALCQFGSA